MNFSKPSQFTGILFFIILIQSCSDDNSVVRVPKDFVYTMGANKYGVIGNTTENDAITPYKVIGVKTLHRLQHRRT